MEQSQSKTKNIKLEAMRNKIKLFSPLLVTTPKIDLSQSNCPSPPCSPYHEILPSPSPIDGFKLSGFAGFSAYADNDQFYLRNIFEQKYETLEKLGEGANGVVRKCRDRDTNQIFAVKIGKMQQQHMVALQRIVNMMRKLKHENILNIKQLYRDSKRSKYYHVIEYLPYPSLRKLISKGHIFTPEVLKKIMSQLFCALQYFHKYYIVHRDIKTSNLLFDIENEKLYVIDLGIITKTIHRGKRRNLWSNNGTLQYKAPQMLMGSSYNQIVDVWAAGVVLYELIEGKTPFKEESHFDIIDRITEIKYQFNQQFWKDLPLAKKLVKMLLKPKSQRLNARECLKAPWFQQINWQQKPMKKNNSTSVSKQFNFLNSSSPFGSAQLSSLAIINKIKNDSDSDIQDEDGYLTNNLTLSSYQPTDEEVKPLNLSDIMLTKKDPMIINNNN